MSRWWNVTSEYYKDSNYDVDDMTYDHEFSDIREETDETVLREEEKLYLCLLYTSDAADE